MKLTRKLTGLAATLALGACAAMPPQYMLIQGSDVVLTCKDGFMTYNDAKASRILVAPYLASQAEYALCAGNARQPLGVRARQAAQKKLGPSCRIDAVSEPLPLNYEFAYVCGVAPAPARPPSVPRPAASSATVLTAPPPAADGLLSDPAPPVLRPSQ